MRTKGRSRSVVRSFSDLADRPTRQEWHRHRSLLRDHMQFYAVVEGILRRAVFLIGDRWTDLLLGEVLFCRHQRERVRGAKGLDDLIVANFGDGWVRVAKTTLRRPRRCTETVYEGIRWNHSGK